MCAFICFYSTIPSANSAEIACETAAAVLHQNVAENDCGKWISEEQEEEWNVCEEDWTDNDQMDDSAADKRQSDQLVTFPDLVINEIVSYLPFRDRLAVQRISRNWCRISKRSLRTAKHLEIIYDYSGFRIDFERLTGSIISFNKFKDKEICCSHAIATVQSSVKQIVCSERTLAKAFSILVLNEGHGEEKSGEQEGQSVIFKNLQSMTLRTTRNNVNELERIVQLVNRRGSFPSLSYFRIVRRYAEGEVLDLEEGIAIRALTSALTRMNPDIRIGLEANLYSQIVAHSLLAAVQYEPHELSTKNTPTINLQHYKTTPICFRSTNLNDSHSQASISALDSSQSENRSRNKRKMKRYISRKKSTKRFPDNLKELKITNEDANRHRATSIFRLEPQNSQLEELTLREYRVHPEQFFADCPLDHQLRHLRLSSCHIVNGPEFYRLLRAKCKSLKELEVAGDSHFIDADGRPVTSRHFSAISSWLFICYGCDQIHSV